MLSKSISATAVAVFTLSVPPAYSQYDFIPQAPAFDPGEILSWDPASDPDAPRNRSAVPLAERFGVPAASENASLHGLWNVNPNARPGEARVQALTTFNTIPAAGTHGWRTNHLYAPTIWQYTDSLVQWGTSDRNNKVILVPTAHTIDAAHRNGVRIYGKIFFNWNGSPDPVTLQKVRDLLVKSGPTFPVADKLVEVAKYYGFDGWFINQENNQTTAADAQDMLDFLAYFRAKAAAEGAPHLKMVWYDAMAEDGSRSFQNAYTTVNDSFLKKDDGTLTAHEMFLNFWWYDQDSRLAGSRAHALARGVNPYDIYAGIWTENHRTLGYVPDANGAGNIAVPWAYLFPEGQQHRHSVALFGGETPFFKGRQPAASAAQDALYWSGPNSDPSNTGTDPVWKGIAHYVPAASVIRTLPFVTHFNTGHGTHYRMEGTTRMTGPWTNLSLQDILPTWQWRVSGPAGKTANATYDFTDAYRGGSSIKIAGPLQTGNPQTLNLYQTRLRADATATLKVLMKSPAAHGATMEIACVFEDEPWRVYYSDPAVIQPEWSEHVFPLFMHEGRTLVTIGVRVSADSAIADFSANLGKIEASSGAGNAPSVPADVVVEGKARNPDEATATMLRLKWKAVAEPVLHYNIWYRSSPDAGSPRVWLGASPIPWFFAQDVRRINSETSGYIEVDAVSPSYATSPASDPIPFEFEDFPNLHHPVIASYPPAAPITVIASSSSSSRNNAFDNSLGTHAEPGSADGAWVGLDLGEGNAKRITAIRFAPRTNWVSRIIGGVFQGSNTADFSSGVVQLAKIEAPPPEGVETTLDVSVETEFRYLRYLSPPGGYANIAEIKFHADGPPIAPTAPTNLQGTLTGSTAKLNWSTPQTGFVAGYSVYRSAAADGPYSVVAANLRTTAFSEELSSPEAEMHYLIKAENDMGTSPFSARLTFNPLPSEKLAGDVISYGAPFSASTTNASKAFDGALNTYFESTVSQSWVGLDLGEGNRNVIHSLRYSPRNSNPSAQTNANFMLGGRFQVAHAEDFSDALTLIAIPSAPEYNILTSVAVPVSNRPWRYVRYITAAGRNANISELEVYGREGEEDAYHAWLLASGFTATEPNSGFDEDIDGDGIPNGVEFLNPGGLEFSTGGPAPELIAILRDDAFSTRTLMMSGDLVDWTPVDIEPSVDQTGVEPGFSRARYTIPSEAGTERRFYRFHFTR